MELVVQARCRIPEYTIRTSIEEGSSTRRPVSNTTLFEAAAEVLGELKRVKLRRLFIYFPQCRVHRSGGSRLTAHACQLVGKEPISKVELWKCVLEGIWADTRLHLW